MILKFFRLLGLPGVKYFSLMLLLLIASFFHKTSGSRSAQTLLKPVSTEHNIPTDEMNIPVDDSAIHANQLTDLEKGEPLHRKTTAVIDRPIEKSLWHTLSTLHMGQKLVNEITRIFRSRIDFRKLRKGDRIILAFDEEIADERFSGAATVRAVSLNHQGKDFYAFYFPDETGGSYYDEKGRSMETAFLPSPVSTGRITSEFSKVRLHPVSGKYTPHYGIDYAAPAGTPIVSIADGLVQETTAHSTKGKFVRIKHSGGYETEYLHMSRYEKGIVPGAHVTQGSVIGYVGTTGTATGPHVELRLKKDGRFIDLSRETFRHASFLPSPLLDCFQERVELFKESMDTGNSESASNFVFTCASEKESEPL
jgi:murein DD-endopeptidase MepM/ murein hydrolase activator NlpD